MTDEISIYHNPRCSKSRQTLAIIEDAGHKPNIILYLENPPKPKELKALLKKLGIEPPQLLRKGEEIYKTLGLSKPDITDDQLIEHMSQHPKLIERPIVVRGDQAILGRPPENVKALLAS